MGGGNNKGFAIKLTYDGEIDWFLHNLATSGSHTAQYTISCSAPNFVYTFGDTIDPEFSTTTRAVQFAIRYHTSGRVMWVRNYYTSGLAIHQEYLGTGDASPDG